MDDPDNISNKSSNLRVANLYFIVILFIALLSTHILHVPSFFGTNNVRTAHGLMLSLTSPLFISSSICFFNSACSVGLVL